MEDEAVLLKIKRQFSKEESVAALLKIIKELRIEIGVLKSDLSELKEKKLPKKTGELKTQKEWLKDEMIIQIKKGLVTAQNRSNLLNRQLNECRNKYLSLLAKENP